MARDGAPSWTSMIRRLGSDGTLVAMLIVVLLVVILLPLPPFLLDFLIACNFVFAVLLLLTGLLHQQPSTLSSFPTVLLLATLLRLAVNVSSTRLILLNGDQGLGVAGSIIRTFGELVVRGNFVVGAIIFAIIAIVNFLVVAKGSARVAEVAARFVLDSVPGRQLAVDSDLRSGRISPDQAADRRDELGRESQFFGAMDGAMKFVQGDAIAGFVIVAVNAIGGLALGVSRGLSWQDSVSTFGVLAIGDGLVNCLPSLLTSLAAGFVVTHVHDRRGQSSGGQVFSQFLGEPRILALAAVSFFLFALLPGFPTYPFAGMGILLLFATLSARSGSAASWREVLAVSADGLPGSAESQKLLLDAGVPELPGRVVATRELLPYTPSQSPPGLSDVSPIDIEIDASTFQGRFDLSLPSSVEAQNFQKFWNQQRDTFYREFGVWLPDVQFHFATDLAPAGYRISFREHTVKNGVLRFGEVFAATPPPVLSLFGGRPTAVVRHPMDYGLSCWVLPERGITQALARLGVPLLDAIEFLAFDVMSSLRNYLGELVGIDDLKREMKTLEQKYPGLYEEVLSKNLLSFPELTEMFRRLLREQVSIRDTKTLLEGIAEFGATNPFEKDRGSWLQELHAHLRRSSSRGLIQQAMGPGGRLRAFLLSSALEEEFRGAVAQWDIGRGRPPLDPEIEQKLRETSKAMFQSVVDRGALPVVLLCSPDIRSAVQDFFGRLFPSLGWFRTISFEELHDQVRPDVVGVLSC